MAMGVADLKRELTAEGGLSEFPEIHQFLDGFYLSRIGIRILIGQHIALHEPQKENHNRCVRSPLCLCCCYWDPFLPCPLPCINNIIPGSLPLFQGGIQRSVQAAGWARFQCWTFGFSCKFLSRSSNLLVNLLASSSFCGRCGEHCPASISSIMGSLPSQGG